MGGADVKVGQSLAVYSRACCLLCLPLLFDPPLISTSKTQHFIHLQIRAHINPKLHLLSIKLVEEEEEDEM